MKKKAEEEIQFLQATGKISKKPANSSTNVKKKVQSKTQAKNQVLADAWEAESDSTPAPPSQRPGTASSVGRKVDDIFQVSVDLSMENDQYLRVDRFRTSAQVLVKISLTEVKLISAVEFIKIMVKLMCLLNHR